MDELVSQNALSIPGSYGLVLQFPYLIHLGQTHGARLDNPLSISECMHARCSFTRHTPLRPRLPVGLRNTACRGGERGGDSHPILIRSSCERMWASSRKPLGTALWTDMKTSPVVA